MVSILTANYRRGTYNVTYDIEGCIFIYINDGAPREALGAINGLAQTTASLMRALAPSTASSLFSVSLEQNIVRGYMVYVVLCMIIVVGVGASSRLPKHLASEVGQ